MKYEISCGLGALLWGTRAKHGSRRGGGTPGSGKLDTPSEDTEEEPAAGPAKGFISPQKLPPHEAAEQEKPAPALPARHKISRDSWPLFDAAAHPHAEPREGATPHLWQQHNHAEPQPSPPSALKPSATAQPLARPSTPQQQRTSTAPHSPSSSSSNNVAAAPAHAGPPAAAQHAQHAQHAPSSFESLLATTIMQQAPCLLTTISIDGSRILFQNAASKEFFGDLTVDRQSWAGEPPACWDHGLAALAASASHEQLPPQHQQLLERLFSLTAPGSLEEMLGNISRGLPWRKVMQVQQQRRSSAADDDGGEAWSQASTEHADFGPEPDGACAPGPHVSSLDLQRPSWGRCSSAPAVTARPSPRHSGSTKAPRSSAPAAAGPIAASLSGGAAAAAPAQLSSGWAQLQASNANGSKGCPADAAAGEQLDGASTEGPKEAAWKHLLRLAEPAPSLSIPGAGAPPASVPQPPTPPQPDVPAAWHWQKPAGGKGMRASLSFIDLAAAATEQAAGAGDAVAEAAAPGSPHASDATASTPLPRHLSQHSAGDLGVFRMSSELTDAELGAVLPPPPPGGGEEKEARPTPTLRRAAAGRGPSLDDGDGEGSSRSCSMDWQEGGEAAGSPFARRSGTPLAPSHEGWRPRRTGIDLSDLLVSPPSRTMSMMQFANSPMATFAGSPQLGRCAALGSGSFALRTSSSGGAAIERPESAAAAAGWPMQGRAAAMAAAAVAAPAAPPAAAAPQSCPPSPAPPQVPSVPQAPVRLAVCSALDSCDNRGSASSIASVPEDHPMAFQPRAFCNARASSPLQGSSPPACVFRLASLSASQPCYAEQRLGAFASARASAPGPPPALRAAALDGQQAWAAEDASPGHAAEAGTVWHDVVAQVLLEPGCSTPMILLTQFDVTSRVQAENCLAWLSERQLSMLSGIFPRHVIEFLSVNHENLVPKQIATLARTHHDVTILFMDICGFTTMAKQIAPETVMSFLNSLFTTFDSMCDEFGVQKVETAGDCYIAAAGILSPDDDGFSVAGGEHDAPNSAQKLLLFAKAMLAASRCVIMPHDGQPLKVRIGLHTGPCVSGLVGTKLPKFSVFGDTMNTASRMESTCTPGHIQVSDSTWKLLEAVGEDASQWQTMGGVQVKGKGLMKTYTWLGGGGGAGDEGAASESAPPCSPGRDPPVVPSLQPFARPASRLGSPSCSARSSSEDKATPPAGEGDRDRSSRGGGLGALRSSSAGSKWEQAVPRWEAAASPVRFHLKRVSESSARPAHCREAGPQGLKAVPAWDVAAGAEPALATKVTSGRAAL